MTINQYGECSCPPGKALLNNFCIPCDPSSGGYVLNNRCYYCPGDLKYDGEKCTCGLN